MYFAIRWRALACAGLFHFLGAAAAVAAAPTITGFDFPGSPTTASVYGFNVHFSAPVTVSGYPMPSITVRVGGVDRQATATSSSGYSNVIFDFNPQSGDNGPLTVPGPIALNGGSIKGADGTDADLTFTPIDNTGITIDTTPPAPPVVNSVTPSSPTYQQSFTFAGTAEPASTISVRGNTRYLLPSGTTDASGNWSITVPAQPAGTYNFSITARDHAGNDSAPTTTSVTVTYLPGNGTSPTITSIQPPGNGLYGGYYNTRHETLHTFVNFSQPVLVSGNPTLTVRIGSVTTELGGAWIDGNAVVFDLNLPSQVYDGTLDITGPINLNGGAITATDGTPATLTFTPVNATGVYIDTTEPPAPVVTGVTPSSPTADQAFTIAGTAEAGDTVQIAALGTYTTVPVDASGHWSATFGPLAAGSYRFGFSAEDKAGNWSYLAGYTGGSPTVYTVTVQPGSSTPPPSSGGSQTQTITFVSPVSAIRVGQPVTLGATSSAGLPITYSVVSGDATINGNVLTPTSTADLIVRAASAGDATYAAASTDVNFGSPQPVPISRLVNISSRVHVSANDSAGSSIAGFVVSGTSPKQFLIRGVGPTLTRYGVGSPLPTPELRLFSNSVMIASNAGWADDAPIAAAATAVNAFPLQSGSKDAALLVTLQPGPYTAQLASSDSGTALIEVYDVTAATTTTKQLINISTRGTVGSGDNVLIGGFVIAGDQPKQVLIRAVAPTIGSIVPNYLRDPMLTLYDAKQAVVAANDNWGTQQPAASGATLGTTADITAAQTATGAFPLETGSADAALLITLPPGSYTAIVTGANGTSGNALVEVYEVP